MAEDDETTTEKLKDQVPTALAGAAIYEGLPSVTQHVLSDAPHGLAMMAMSGKPISEEFGTPLSRLAEFTRSEVKAIQGFAQQQGVTVPIVAAGPGFNSGYFVDNPGPLRRLLSRVVGGGGEAVEAPHIALSHGSVPYALHEIGHASPILGSDALRRTWQGLGQTLGQNSRIGTMLRAAIASSVLTAPPDDTAPVRKFLYDHAPALVGATMIPELLEEARATGKALGGASAHGPGVLRTLAELAPGFGTYLASAAAPVLATILAKHVVAALRNASANKVEEEEKQAAAPATEVKAPGALRTSASAAWKIGQNPPKPKTIGPQASMGEMASGRAPAKPPSKTSYYSDLLTTLYNPSRGARIATPG